MFLKVLGSAAAEGWPAPFCVCQACQEARRRGGKDLRRRTSYQLGDHVHIDWGPDSYHSMLALGLDYSPLRHLLITHSHQDHWCPEELAWRRSGYSQIPEGSRLKVYGNRQVEEKLRAEFDDLKLFSLSFKRLKPFAKLSLEPDITALVLPASHAEEDEEALNFLLTTGGRTVLIGNDTGWWAKEVWEFLQDHPLHVVLLDSTSGPLDRRPDGQPISWVGTHHFSCSGVVAVRDELARRGILAPDCRFIANHFSHNGGWLHEDLEKYFVPQGIEVGFDGMTIEV
jgi:phosphoribosyl 1,2-cyclic phosphate phosphodiesterase